MPKGLQISTTSSLVLLFYSLKAGKKGWSGHRWDELFQAPLGLTCWKKAWAPHLSWKEQAGKTFKGPFTRDLSSGMLLASELENILWLLTRFCFSVDILYRLTSLQLLKISYFKYSQQLETACLGLPRWAIFQSSKVLGICVYIYIYTYKKCVCVCIHMDRKINKQNTETLLILKLSLYSIFCQSWFFFCFSSFFLLKSMLL